MKRIFFSVLAGAASLFIIWCFGFDLTKRGLDLGMAAIWTFIAVGVAALFPYKP